MMAVLLWGLWLYQTHQRTEGSPLLLLEPKPKAIKVDMLVCFDVDI
jgi:hypothetical protein